MIEEIKTIEDAKELKEKLDKLRHSKTMPIFIVEENFILKKLIGNMLDQMGFSNLLVNLTPFNCLDKMSEESDGVIIYSISHKSLSGENFLRAFKAKRNHENFKVILLTNRMNIADLEKIADLGAHALLFKPVEIKGMVEALQLAGAW